MIFLRMVSQPCHRPCYLTQSHRITRRCHTVAQDRHMKSCRKELHCDRLRFTVRRHHIAAARAEQDQRTHPLCIDLLCVVKKICHKPGILQTAFCLYFDCIVLHFFLSAATLRLPVLPLCHSHQFRASCFTQRPGSLIGKNEVFYATFRFRVPGSRSAVQRPSSHTVCQNNIPVCTPAPSR